VVSALGQDGSRTRVEVTGDTVLLTVDPAVAGLPTSGFSVVVTAGPEGVRAAWGWLGEPAEGASYPLVGARAAFVEYAGRTGPVAPSVDDPASVDEPSLDGPTGRGAGLVVGARLGLAFVWAEGDRPLLVPAWLYDVEGTADRLAVPAVDPAYVEPPSTGSPIPVEPGGGSGGSAGPPGDPEPGDPPGGTGPDEPATRFEPVVLDRSGTQLTARFYGGVEDCYDYRLTVEESPDRVVLRLVETATSDGPCIELAQEYERTVTLREQLGDRPVVDGSTGHEVLLRRPRD
jgi:hypothetical protein